MEGTLGITGVAAITVICTLIGEVTKVTKVPNQYIPVICGLCGCLLGMAGLYLMPDFPAQNLLSAAAVGIVSGFAATGMYEAVRQLGHGV